MCPNNYNLFKTYVSMSWGISSKSSKVLWFASRVWFNFLFSKISSADSINSVQPDVRFGISVICKANPIYKHFSKELHIFKDQKTTTTMRHQFTIFIGILFKRFPSVTLSLPWDYHPPFRSRVTLNLIGHIKCTSSAFFLHWLNLVHTNVDREADTSDGKNTVFKYSYFITQGEIQL